MIPSRKLIVRWAMYLLVVIFGVFLLSRHWDSLSKKHAGHVATHAAPKDNHDAMEASADENVQSPDIENLPADAPSKFQATTNPNEDGFRNTLTFRSVQKYLGHRHEPSETAYNCGGFESMLTLRIVDQHGIPVPGVPFRVAPMLSWGHLPSVSLCTDSNGCAQVRHPCANSYTIFIKKDGYYDIYGTIQFFSHHYVCVDENRWIPWNPQVELVLKRQMPLVRLYHFKSWEHPPEFPSNTDVPFDFLAGDFLPPYGSGKETNAVIRMSGSTEGTQSWHSETSISFPLGGGMRREVVNGFSRFAFPREIAEDDFCRTLTILRDVSRNAGTKVTGGVIRGKEYFALKIPTMTDSGTNGYAYGVITKGPTADLIDENSTNASLYIEYYLNTEVGNRVIESKELIGK